MGYHGRIWLYWPNSWAFPWTFRSNIKRLCCLSSSTRGMGAEGPRVLPTSCTLSPEYATVRVCINVHARCVVLLRLCHGRQYNTQYLTRIKHLFLSLVHEIKSVCVCVSESIVPETRTYNHFTVLFVVDGGVKGLKACIIRVYATIVQLTLLYTPTTPLPPPSAIRDYHLSSSSSSSTHGNNALFLREPRRLAHISCDTCRYTAARTCCYSIQSKITHQ